MQAVANLVDNALKYGTGGGEVVREAARRDREIHICVSTGPLVSRPSGERRRFAEAAFAARQASPEHAFAAAGYRFGDDPALVGQHGRVAVLRDADFAPVPTVEATVRQLDRNPKGYFLMVEWDMRTPNPLKGLRHAVEMDDLIRRISAVAGKIR